MDTLVKLEEVKVNDRIRTARIGHNVSGQVTQVNRYNGTTTAIVDTREQDRLTGTFVVVIRSSRDERVERLA